MITVKFFRIGTQKIQTFKNVVSVVAQLQNSKDAHYKIIVSKLNGDRNFREIVEYQVPMNDGYINSLF